MENNEQVEAYRKEILTIVEQMKNPDHISMIYGMAEVLYKDEMEEEKEHTNAKRI